MHTYIHVRHSFQFIVLGYWLVDFFGLLVFVNVVLPVASVVGFKPLVRWELGVECCTRQAFLLFPWVEVAHAVGADHTCIL